MTDIDIREQERRHRVALSDRLVNEFYDDIYGHSVEALVYFEMARKFLNNPNAKLSEVWGQLFEEFACDENKIAHDYEILEFIAAQCRRYGAGQ
jgi:hypothetical protein